jgi:hypothetical protein
MNFKSIFYYFIYWPTWRSWQPYGKGFDAEAS